MAGRGGKSRMEPIVLTRDQADDLTDVLLEWRELRVYKGGSVAVFDGYKITWDRVNVRIERVHGGGGKS